MSNVSSKKWWMKYTAKHCYIGYWPKLLFVSKDTSKSSWRNKVSFWLREIIKSDNITPRIKLYTTVQALLPGVWDWLKGLENVHFLSLIDYTVQWWLCKPGWCHSDISKAVKCCPSSVYCCCYCISPANIWRIHRDCLIYSHRGRIKCHWPYWKSNYLQLSFA